MKFYLMLVARKSTVKSWNKEYPELTYSQDLLEWLGKRMGKSLLKILKVDSIHNGGLGSLLTGFNKPNASFI